MGEEIEGREALRGLSAPTCELSRRRPMGGEGCSQRGLDTTGVGGRESLNWIVYVRCVGWITSSVVGFDFGVIGRARHVTGMRKHWSTEHVEGACVTGFRSEESSMKAIIGLAICKEDCHVLVLFLGSQPLRLADPPHGSRES